MSPEEHLEKFYKAHDLVRDTVALISTAWIDGKARIETLELEKKGYMDLAISHAEALTAAERALVEQRKNLDAQQAQCEVFRKQWEQARCDAVKFEVERDRNAREHDCAYDDAVNLQKQLTTLEKEWRGVQETLGALTGETLLGAAERIMLVSDDLRKRFDAEMAEHLVTSADLVKCERERSTQAGIASNRQRELVEWQEKHTQLDEKFSRQEEELIRERAGRINALAKISELEQELSARVGERESALAQAGNWQMQFMKLVEARDEIVRQRDAALARNVGTGSWFSRMKCWLGQ